MLVLLLRLKFRGMKFPAIDQNGVITMYEILFVPLETFEGQISTNNIIVYTSNGSLLLIVLTGLEEYVEYNISVRAYSNAGLDLTVLEV